MASRILVGSGFFGDYSNAQYRCLYNCALRNAPKVAVFTAAGATAEIFTVDAKQLDIN